MEWRRVLESLDVAVIVLGAPVGNILYANAKASSLLGITVEEIVGRTADDAQWDVIDTHGNPVLGDGHPGIRALRTAQAVSGQTIGVRVGSADRVWILVSAVPDFDEAGLMTRVIVSFSDVTATQREVRTQGAIDRTVFSSMSDGLAIHAPDGSVLAVNASAERALTESLLQSQRILAAIPGVVCQYRPSAEGPGELVIVGGKVREVLGSDEDPKTIGMDWVLARLSAEDRPRVLAELTKATQNERPFECTARIEGADGMTRWMRAIGQPERTARGLLYTGVIRDATAEVQMEEALRRAAKREWMGEMSAGIAHNFNNMLEVILPNVEMARELLPPDDRELLDDAERAAVRAADLVKRMMELGRSELGTESATCDLVPVVREAMHLARSTMDPGIRLEEVVRVESAIVRGRASSYQQVLLNLLFNARDALRDTAVPYIYVGLHHDGPDAIRLEVRDNGHGIPEHVLPRLGEPFFTTRGPSQGTGLGLASVVRAVEEAGGKWEVHSRPGTGATFTIRIPIEQGAVAAGAATVSAGATPQDGAVLIVDDEEMVRDVLSRQVVRAGLTPRALPSAEEAIEYLLSEQPTDIRAIILDLSMPGLSGSRALPILKALTKDVPVIIVSGHAQSTDGFEGAAAVLQKPLGFRDLQATLARVLNRTTIAVA
jgi:signal transduction histidine kinase/ActR/RegA family two-component response regulator